MEEHKRSTRTEIDANEVREYLENNYRNKLSIEQICINKKSSSRIILTVFNKLFGFSPKQYLTQCRLGKAHHALLESNPKSTTVKKVANEHGFTHMGRFANQYKSMFGKKPSSSLQKSSPLAQLC